MLPSATPYDLLFPQIGFTTPTKTPITVISGTAKATHFKFSMHIQQLSGHSSHRAVIFAITQLSCLYLYAQL